MEFDIGLDRTEYESKRKGKRVYYCAYAGEYGVESNDCDEMYQEVEYMRGQNGNYEVKECWARYKAKKKDPQRRDETNHQKTKREMEPGTGYCCR